MGGRDFLSRRPNTGAPPRAPEQLAHCRVWGARSRSYSGLHSVTVGGECPQTETSGQLAWGPRLPGPRALPPPRKLSFQPVPSPTTLGEGRGDKVCSSPPPTDVRACASTPCLNNGTCVNLDSGLYACSCAPGFSGKDCQEKAGPCVING